MGQRHLWHSLYWKIAVSFIGLVVVVLLSQGVMFSFLISEQGGPFMPGNPNAAAGAIAVSVAKGLTADPAQPVGLLLRRAMGPSPQLAFVMMRTGELVGTSDRPLNDTIRRQYEAVLSGRVVESLPGDRPTSPVVTAPIEVQGRLVGLVLLPPPGDRGVLGELTRVLSLPGTVVLLVAAAAAALLIFAPARRRLRSLEVAVERLGAGDLAARAPDHGRDEIARVAAAFNRMATELSARTEALRASDELRRQMVADVSHDLKTPLTAMSGYLDTLTMREVDLDPDTRTRLLETARHETYRLRRIVADLLDLARQENEVGDLGLRVFDVERLFAHVVARHEREAAKVPVSLLTHVAAGADQLVADPDRIEQAVDNLVDNAVRHSSAGGTVELISTSTTTTHRLSVVDSGPGIAPEHQKRIFERFFKVDGARTSGQGGSGLGLSIVQAIAARHGGTVTVNSRPGRTEFVIELPQRIATGGGVSATSSS